MPSIFMVRVCEIRYEKYAHLAGHLSIDKLRRNRCKKALTHYRENIMLYNVI